MVIVKTYQFRLEPTSEQERQFAQFAGCRRYVWNWALARKQDVYKQTGKTFPYKNLAAELVVLKKQPETAFLTACPSQVLQQTLRDLDQAFVSFFQKRAGFPRFKSRKRTPHTFRIPQNIRVVDGKVSIPKIGLIKARLHRQMEGVVKSATVKQEADGHWFVCFVSHLQLPDAQPDCEAPVGIDVGLESFFTLNTGEKVKPPKFYRRAERKLKRLQRQLSRSQKISRRRTKRKQRLAVAHARVRHQRKDWLHKITSELIRLYDTLCIEDLNLRGLVKTKLAKSFLDAALGAFFRMLDYKAVWYNRQIVKVDRFFPSTKMCHGCGHQQSLKLADRQWVCEQCETLHDRDINAAINLLVEGMRLLALGMRESLKRRWRERQTGESQQFPLKLEALPLVGGEVHYN